eukprot:CAMPEP_0198430896 /NCGR_PEP_ID=MMETSP1452-20131203/16265_1 /TAXON_ID=1181717 /ORGANISM="Synchroma pusillum, Strain CCMP3072" /LENGTH=289 /DNA_ID=CAMNT_0044151347 /DNA_START=1 /DNA_END=870 /DNA_ORIENTATION=+
MSTQRKLLLLRALRKARAREPAVTRDCGVAVLAASGLGDERYVVLEQVVVACLELGDLEQAQSCLGRLQAQFPSSSRVKRLTGMHLEALGRGEEALKLYDEVLQENPANLLVLKRKAAVAMAQGKTREAIERLNEVIDTFQCDQPTWQELGEIYLANSNLESAAFCYEELVLLQPGNPAYHTRLAEVYYTQGDLAGLVKARKHYAQSLAIQRQGNLRALLGLVHTCQTLLAAHGEAKGRHNALRGDEKETTEALLGLGTDLLAQATAAAPAGGGARDFGELAARALQLG